MDLVYASHVVEHLADPVTVLSFVQEAYRVLRPNGLLVLSAPDLLAFGKAFWDADYTHTFPVTERRLRQLLSDGQFEIVQTINIAGPIRGPLSHILSCLAWFMPTNLVFVSQNTRTRLIRLRLTFLRNICVIARKGAKSDR
jgi:predicted SAM-dependent methyltransferase